VENLMGRRKGSKNKPKEIIIPIAPKESENNTPVVEPSHIKKEKPPKELKPMCQCDLCGINIYDSPFTANLSYLSGLASWYRWDMPNKIKLCKNCSVELSKLIETWYKKKVESKK
jgi:hypothetical protein